MQKSRHNNAPKSDGFAAAGKVEDIDLLFLVISALGGEHDLPAVRAPVGVALTAIAGSQSPWRGAGVGRHDPQVRDVTVLLVRRFGDREYDPSSVGRRHG